jgi:hypothetical protein
MVWGKKTCTALRQLIILRRLEVVTVASVLRQTVTDISEESAVSIRVRHKASLKKSNTAKGTGGLTYLMELIPS